MRPSIVACFLVLGAFGCAGTQEPEGDAPPDVIHLRVRPERTAWVARAEDVRIYRNNAPSCPYETVGAVRSDGPSRSNPPEGTFYRTLREQAFAQRADAIINLVDTGTGGKMGTAIIFTDPDCRY